MLKMHSLLLLLWIFSLTLSDCPPNSVKWPDDPPSKCYSIFNTFTLFVKAELACNSAGGHLSSVHSGFENTFLHREGNSSFTGSTMSDFWIGAKRPTNQNNWTWTDGTPFDFTEWQDDGSGNGQACAAVLLRTGRWSARDCGQLKPYICESSEVSESTTSAVPGSTAGSTAATGSTAAPCVDTIPDCQKYLAQCKDPNYQDLMYKKCRKTCNLCNACLDTDERCKKWASNGFCTNPFYQQIWSECRKSCGFCT